jgi:hypothetical protein
MRRIDCRMASETKGNGPTETGRPTLYIGRPLRNFYRNPGIFLFGHARGAAGIGNGMTDPDFARFLAGRDR